MPKIDVRYDELCGYIGRKITVEELEKIFPAAKAELDEAPDANGILKVELNDTNRPDLWSTAGLGRLIRVYEGGKAKPYPFFSRGEEPRDSAKREVRVDANLRDIRPFIAAFVAEGHKVNEQSLESLIQSQEKLCWNFGRKRRSIAMGIYRADLVTFPVTYKGVKPRELRFRPLGMSTELNLEEILSQHPKGKEYGHIVRDFELFPILLDAKGKVLSFPPIINSDDLGAVKVGDDRLFVELTGTDLPSLLLAANIMACDMADSGFTIQPVAIDYPSPTLLGQRLTTPYYFQSPVATTSGYIRKLLGENLSLDHILTGLKKLGNSLSVSGDDITVFPAEYRNDFLHPVDIVEDVMIGRGLESFEPELPHDFTIGRLTDIERLSREVKTLMVGLGYQEMTFNYLGSGRDLVERMHPGGEGDYSRTVRIANPMSENFEFVRDSILPNLLGAESVSGNSPYPHSVFEVGKVAHYDESENYLSRTDTSLGFISAQAAADFNLANSQVQALLYFLSKKYELKESADPRFIPGRRADIVIDGKVAGVLGEIHPGVLSNWGITVPCCACEIALNLV